MISIRDFHFSYGKVAVFAGVSTTLTPGHIYGILGKNGTGKSTLLYNIAGLLYPKQGRITVNGEDPSKRSPQFLEEIFMVPEEFYLPNVAIRSFVKYYSPFYPRFDPIEFERHLNSFEIPAGSKLQGMSYGQRKKVYISFGIASNASVLLMDEPTNGLDIISKTQLRKVIAGAATPEKTILISSHQVKDLENLIDEVLILDGTAIALKQSLDHIAKKLTFKISFDDNDLREALYAESVLKGNTIVIRKRDDEESHVDLELLYKATVANPARMNTILTSNSAR